jgi:phospholipase/carboxylesterase
VLRLLPAALALVLTGCGLTGASPSAAQGAEGPAPLPYVEQVTGGADPESALPLVVTLHGRGSTPESFRQFFESMDAPARLIHLRAPIEEHDGRAWFTFWNHSRAGLMDEMRTLAERAVATAEQVREARPTRGEPLITGFSQGAMLVYVIALRHPEAFAAALPVSGVCFDGFYGDVPPERYAEMPPIVAFHGLDDPIIPVRSERRTIEALQRRGVTAELRTFPDVPHWIMRGLRTDLHAEIARRTRARVEG